MWFTRSYKKLIIVISVLKWSSNIHIFSTCHLNTCFEWFIGWCMTAKCSPYINLVKTQVFFGKCEKKLLLVLLPPSQSPSMPYLWKHKILSSVFRLNGGKRAKNNQISIKCKRIWKYGIIQILMHILLSSLVQNFFGVVPQQIFFLFIADYETIKPGVSNALLCFTNLFQLVKKDKQ